MMYAVYNRSSELELPYSSKDLKVMNDTQLQEMIMDFLMKDMEIEEDELIELSFKELINLYEDSLIELSESYNNVFDRVLIVDEKNKVIIDV